MWSITLRSMSKRVSDPLLRNEESPGNRRDDELGVERMFLGLHGEVLC
jgi:hypothetical protein